MKIGIFIGELSSFFIRDFPFLFKEERVEIPMIWLVCERTPFFEEMVKDTGREDLENDFYQGKRRW